MTTFTRVDLTPAETTFLRNRYCQWSRVFNLIIFKLSLALLGSICLVIFLANLLSGKTEIFAEVPSLVIFPLILSAVAWMMFHVIPQLYQLVLMHTVISHKKKWQVIGEPSYFDKEAKLYDETDYRGEQRMTFTSGQHSLTVNMDIDSDEPQYVAQGGRFEITYVDGFGMFEELSRKRI